MVYNLNYYNMMDVIIYPVKILSPTHPVKIQFSSEDFTACVPGQDRQQSRSPAWTLAFPVLLTTGGRRKMATRSVEVEELSAGQKFSKYLDFEVYVAKCEASTW